MLRPQMGGREEKNMNRRRMVGIAKGVNSDEDRESAKRHLGENAQWRLGAKQLRRQDITS